MRIKQLNSYILATVKVSPTFSASSVLFQVCEQYIQSFLFSTSWLASFVYCASGDLCLAFWHWHPAVAFRAGIEGESPSPAPSYCTGHLLFSRLFWQNHLPCSDHKLFGVPILVFLDGVQRHQKQCLLFTRIQQTIKMKSIHFLFASVSIL